jgi:hypothetical protein
MPRRAMVVELQRDADHVVAGIGEQRRRDGGIDPARHGDDNARVGRPALDIEPVEHGHTISAAHRRRHGCPFTAPCTGEFLRPAKLPPARKGCRASPAAAAAQSLERTWFVARAPFGPPVARLRASDRDSAEVFCRAAYPVRSQRRSRQRSRRGNKRSRLLRKGTRSRSRRCLMPPRPRHRRRPHRPRQRQRRLTRALLRQAGRPAVRRAAARAQPTP